MPRPIVREILLCLCGILGSLGICAVQGQLWSKNFTELPGTGGDLAFTLLSINNFLTTGDPCWAPASGAPYGASIHDFPLCETTHLLFIRGLTFFSSDPIVLYNLFYLLSFPLATVTSILVCRALGIGAVVSVVVSLLFAFTPSHFLRHSHLFLSAQYLIPPLFLLLAWVYQRKLSLDPGATPAEQATIRGRRYLAMAIAVLVAGGGVYYAFFGCFFLVVAGVSSVIRTRLVATAFPACFLIAIIGLGVLVQSSPASYLAATQGRNTEVAVRAPFEADIYGLRLIYLLLPASDHPSDSLARITRDYNDTTHFPHSESQGTSFGLIGAVSFLVLLGWFAFSPRRNQDGYFHLLGVLVVSGLFLGLSQGIGYLLNLVVTPQIRCYNRISVYLCYFVLIALALVLDAWYRKAAAQSSRVSLLATLALFALLAAGIYDQTPRSCASNAWTSERPWEPIRECVSRLEATLPAQTAILQLPTIPFPETNNREQMGCYDHFRFAIVSRNLRWSHGVPFGRYSAQILTDLGHLPTTQLVEQAIYRGYRAIHVDCFGYKDRGKQLIAELQSLLQVEPIYCRNQRDLFFDLTDAAARLQQSHSVESWENRCLSVRYPIAVSLWKSVASDRYLPDQPRIFRFGAADIELHNPFSVSRPVTCRFHLASTRSADVSIRWQGQAIDSASAVSQAGCSVTLTLEVPPGKHWLQIRDSARGSRAYFTVRDFRIEPLEASAHSVSTEPPARVSD